MKNKIAIYTCITGGYESPTDGFNPIDGYEYILFSDVPIKTKSWKNYLISYNVDTLSDVKKQRFIKTHPHVLLKDYDVVVWIDANTDINNKLYEYIEKYKNNQLVFKKHPVRDCIYDEIKEVVFLGKEKQEIGLKIYQNYQRMKFPAHYGLYETNIIISNPKDERVNTLYTKWWSEIFNNSHRDQLSLNYVIWRYKLSDFITVTDSKEFKPKLHIKRK